jgi:hypothetical protein
MFLCKLHFFILALAKFPNCRQQHDFVRRPVLDRSTSRSIFKDNFFCQIESYVPCELPEIVRDDLVGLSSPLVLFPRLSMAVVRDGFRSAKVNRADYPESDCSTSNLS